MDWNAESVTSIGLEAVDAGVEPAVVVRDVNHSFGDGAIGRQVLQQNSLTLLPGEMTIMTGPSGSGKSTLLTLIGGLRRLQEGSIRVLGRELRGLDEQQLTDVRRNIGFIFQSHNLFDALTAVQNVRTALDLHDYEPALRDRRAAEILTALGLAEHLGNKPHQLSGGQRQRVAIARALANRPKLVLADEPTAALDKGTGREVIEMFKALARTNATTILLVTHDSRFLDVADRIVNLIDGRVASDIAVQEAARIIELLQACPLFRSSAPSVLAQIAQAMAPERFARGTVIVRRGEPADTFYLIRRGAVDLRDGDEVSTLMATPTAGCFFGEISLTSVARSEATVIAAADDTVLYSLTRDKFLSVAAAGASLQEQLREAFFTRSGAH